MTPRSSARPRSSPLVPDERVVCSSSSSIGTSTHGDAGPAAVVLAKATAAELLRVSLLAKFDLEDPVLARRAARYATSSARLLSGLDFPAGTDHHDDEDQPLPEVEDLLERMPSRRELTGDEDR